MHFHSTTYYIKCQLVFFHRQKIYIFSYSENSFILKILIQTNVREQRPLNARLPASE
jgi:hypothetical protein